MRYVLIICLFFYYSNNYTCDNPSFSKYFKIGFIPYKDKQERDTFFWFYRPQIQISDGAGSSYIGLYRVRSHACFIKYLEKHIREHEQEDVYETTRSVYASYIKSPKKLESFSGKFEVDVQDEVIRICKENDEIHLPKELTALYNQFLETAKNSKGLKYIDFMCEYLQQKDYEGTFVCISPDKAKKFFTEVEKNYQKKQKQQASKRD